MRLLDIEQENCRRVSTAIITGMDVLQTISPADQEQQAAIEQFTYLYFAL